MNKNIGSQFPILYCFRCQGTFENDQGNFLRLFNNLVFPYLKINYLFGFSKIDNFTGIHSLNLSNIKQPMLKLEVIYFIERKIISVGFPDV